MIHTLDDLLEAVPGLRRLRCLNADLLRIMLDRRAKECTWCGAPVSKGRSRWCGDECVKAFKLRCDTGYLRSFVEKRDAGICRVCGRDTIAAEKDYRQLANRLWTWKSQSEEYQAALQTLTENGYARGVWREVDHTIPVVEGGGLCGPDGVRLVCGTCHLAATNELAKRRATTRKGA